MTRSAPAEDRSWPLAVAMPFAAAVGLAILGLCLFAAQARVDDPDALFYAYCGRWVTAGQQLYVDLWDNKPPGIFWANALGLWAAGGSYVGVVAVCSAAVVSTWVAFFLVARRLCGANAAVVGAVMATLYVNFYDYHVGSNRPSTFFLFFDVCAFFFYCRSFDKRSSTRLNAFWAGVCAAGAIAFKQIAVAALASIVAHQVYLLVARRRGWAGLNGVLVPMLLGGLCATALVVGILWWTSDLGAAWQAIVESNVGYFTASRQSHLIPEIPGWNDRALFLALPAVLAAGALIHAVISFFVGIGEGQRLCREGSPPAPMVLLVAWLVAAIYLALVGPRRAAHYYGMILPPLVMLATHGVWLLFRPWGLTAKPRFHVIVILLWFVILAWPALKHEVEAARLAHFQRFDARATQRYAATVDTIRRHTQPTDAIYLWRYRPQIQWDADRPVAHRYILDVVIDQWGDQAQPFVDEVIGGLRTRPPKVLVVGRTDLELIERPPVDHPVNYGDFADWLRRNYTVPEDCKRGDVWVRND